MMIMSERWWNKRLKPSSLHENMSAFHAQRYQHKSSGFQRRDYSTQMEYRNGKRHIDEGRKNCLAVHSFPCIMKHRNKTGYSSFKFYYWGKNVKWTYIFWPYIFNGPEHQTHPPMEYVSKPTCLLTCPKSLARLTTEISLPNLVYRKWKEWLLLQLRKHQFNATSFMRVRGLRHS